MNTKAQFGEQWDTCQRCGLDFPMSMLTTQRGMRLCAQSCVDNLDVEKRDREIAMKLTAGAQLEGADLRFMEDRMVSLEDL